MYKPGRCQGEGAGLEEVPLDPLSGLLGRAALGQEKVRVGRVVIGGPLACCSLGHGRVTKWQEKAVLLVLRFRRTAPSHSKVTSPRTAGASKSGREDGLSEKSHRRRPTQS